MENERKNLKKTYVPPRIEKIEFDKQAVVYTSGAADNNNEGLGRGRGGGCDGVPYHRPPRTFSSGRNSGC